MPNNNVLDVSPWNEVHRAAMKAAWVNTVAEEGDPDRIWRKQRAGSDAWLDSELAILVNLVAGIYPGGGRPHVEP